MSIQEKYPTRLSISGTREKSWKKYRGKLAPEAFARSASPPPRPNNRKPRAFLGVVRRETQSIGKLTNSLKSYINCNLKGTMKNSSERYVIRQNIFTNRYEVNA